MICTSFFAFASIFEEKEFTKLHFEDLACKYYEFFPLWYLYVRRFLPEEHLYIVDAGSPIPIDFVLSKLPEPFEIIPEDSFKLDPRVKIHCKRFQRPLPHKEGASRTSIDFLKICYLYKSDYVLIESDVLVGYYLFPDFIGLDFVTQAFVHRERTIEEGAICFVHRDLIKKRVEDATLRPYFEAVPGTAVFVESDFYRVFFVEHVRFGTLSRPRGYVHKVPAVELHHFIMRNRLKHPYVDLYLKALEKQIDRRGPIVRS